MGVTGEGEGRVGDGAPYELEVLTVAEVHTHKPCQIQSPHSREPLNGCAGHCLLTYPSGGRLLTSMTHWVELVKLDVSQERILETFAREHEEEYRCCSTEVERAEVDRKLSVQLVQQSAPACSKAK